MTPEEKRLAAIRLYRGGLSTQEIAIQLGFTDRSAVWRLLQKSGVAQQIGSVTRRSEWSLGDPHRADRSLRRFSWEAGQ